MNRLSILNEVPQFDLCVCIPHVIMHVLLGVLPCGFSLSNISMSKSKCLNMGTVRKLMHLAR